MDDFDEYDDYDDLDEVDDFDDGFDDDYDDYDDDLDDELDSTDVVDELSDYEIEDAGFMDGQQDSNFGVLYGSYGMSVDLDELSDEQRDLYESGYYNGAQGAA